MELTNKELLHTQNSVANQNTDNQQSSQTIKREPVKDTGFEIITIEGKGSFITLGKFRLTDLKETPELCRDMIRNRDWELILGLMGAVLQNNDEIKEENEKQLKLALEQEGPITGNYGHQEDNFDVKERLTLNGEQIKNQLEKV